MDLVLAYLRDYMHSKGGDRVGNRLGGVGGLGRGGGNAPNAVIQALREAGDEFELRYRRAFSDLTSQLHITPGTAYQSFEQVVNELFRDGVNWGRIVAFFSFGGALSVAALEGHQEEALPSIVQCMCTCMQERITPWVQENGGWNAFVSKYGGGKRGSSRPHLGWGCLFLVIFLSLLLLARHSRRP